MPVLRQRHGCACRQSNDRTDVFGFLLRLDAAAAFLGIAVIAVQYRGRCRQTVQSRAKRLQ